jgi:uncharacterized protein YciI
MEHDPWPVATQSGLMPVQFYLCISRILDDPPADAPSMDTLRSAHKAFIAGLVDSGRIASAGRLHDDNTGEKSALGQSMFLLRADSRAEAETIALSEPFTHARVRAMTIIPWQRVAGSVSLSVDVANGALKLDRRAYDIPINQRSHRDIDTPP